MNNKVPVKINRDVLYEHLLFATFKSLSDNTIPFRSPGQNKHRRKKWEWITFSAPEPLPGC